MTAPVRAGIAKVPEEAWVAALNQDATERPNGQVAELTELLDLSRWPQGTRLICRRERAHPGAQLSFTYLDGYRFQTFLTDQPDPDIAVLERRQRQRARAEDHIRRNNDTGLAKLAFLGRRFLCGPVRRRTYFVLQLQFPESRQWSSIVR